MMPLAVLVARLETALELTHLALVKNDVAAAGGYLDKARTMAEQIRGEV